MTNAEHKKFGENFGKTLIDLGKIAFGGVVIGGFMKLDASPEVVIAAGLVLAISASTLGLWFLVKRS
ncbi:hypothetical protein FACS1894139_10800 [Planctomycetales bacterium]|nr:hypothetical protein FACS1894108_08440 [Planctomycetales bacterium]GHT05978.1 hypothetical protein FACS1894139_10800 [Planctomycetales bacterium]